MNPLTWNLEQWFSPETRSRLVELGATFGTRILGAVAILAIGYLLAQSVSRAVKTVLSRRRVDGTVVSFTETALFWAICLLAGAASLSVFGVGTTTIAAVIGGAGVGIGLALKGNLANLASGILLLAVRPFTEGDLVIVDGREGRIREIGLFTTSIDTLDNRRIIVPNDDMFDDAVENSEFHAERRVDLEVGVSYDADLREVVEVLTEALEAHPDAIDDRDVLVRCIGFGASSIDFLLGVWVKTPQYFPARHEAFLLVKEALDDAGIGIPFPQRVVHTPTLELMGGRDDSEVEAQAAK